MPTGIPYSSPRTKKRQFDSSLAVNDTQFGRCLKELDIELIKCCLPGPKGDPGPQGPAGPEGPAGPAGTIASGYADRYIAPDVNIREYALGEVIPLAFSYLTPKNITYIDDYTLEIQLDGIYHISYGVYISNDESSVTFESTVIGIRLNEAYPAHLTAMGAALHLPTKPGWIERQIITPLYAGDTIALGNAGTKTLLVYSNEGVGAYLNVMRIDDM